MAIYAVQYTYSEDTDALDEHRPAHRAFLSGLAEDGVVLVSGPMARQADGPAAALLLLSGDSEEAVLELLREDPFQQLGLVLQVGIHRWDPVIGAGWLLEGLSGLR
jgi:uncharacterized protein